MARTASNQRGICPQNMHVRRIPKVSIIMEVTTKIVREKAKQNSKQWLYFFCFINLYG